MPVITISSEAFAYSGDPRNGTPVTDPEALALLHGVFSDETCAENLEDEEFQSLDVAGGRLRFVFCRDTNSLRIKTAYDVSREPNETEQFKLIEATVAQWSDGIGSGSFENHNVDVFSTALAIALQNSGYDEVGDLFVDAASMLGDQDIHVEFSETGRSDDELIKDLISDSEAGNLAAMTALGLRYESGEGVDQDQRSAVELYRRAAREGEPYGMTLLGICCLAGIGCGKDEALAKKWFKKAVDLEFPLAMHCLGEMYESLNPDNSVALYRQGASLGDPGCLAELGDCLEFGKGVKKDLTEALECYQRCIEIGFDAVLPAIERIEGSL